MSIGLKQGSTEKTLAMLQKRIKHFLLLVTPLIAAQFLARNVKNRAIKEAHVDKLVRDQQAGRWAFTGQPIIFDIDGNLTNGQHTLTAIVQSGKPQVLLIVEGVDPESILGMDGGVKRSFSDWLKIHGYQHCAISQSVTRYLRQYELGTMASNGNFTSAELEETFQQNPDIDVAAAFTSKILKSLPFATPKVIGFVRLITSRIDEEKSLVFFEKLATGAQLDKTSPILNLRNYLLNKKNIPGVRLGVTSELAAFIKSWNSFYKGRSVKQLRWSPGAGESFPTFEE